MKVEKIQKITKEIDSKKIVQNILWQFKINFNFSLKAIHCDNSELISIFEEKCPKQESFKEALIEVIK